MAKRAAPSKPTRQEREALLAQLEKDKADLNAVKALLGRNPALVNAKLDDASHRSLHLAAIRGHTAIAQALLAAGAGVDLRDRFRRTALHYVAAGAAAHTRVARFLIASGAELNARDSVGDTPLALARLFGRRSLTALLRRAGARE